MRRAVRDRSTVACTAGGEGRPPIRTKYEHFRLEREGELGSPKTLGWALTHWAIGPDGVNAAGAWALVDGYRSVAGSPPPRSMDMFRGAVVSEANYVLDQVEHALCARDAEDDCHAARSVRHLLSEPPSRDNLERLLKVVSA